MTMALAIAVAATVVGVGVGYVVSQATRRAIGQAIGGRDGVDPVDEHRRLLTVATRETSAAKSQAEILRLSLDAMTSGVTVTDSQGEVLVRNRLATQVSTSSHEQTLVDATASQLLSTAATGHADEREIDVFGPPARTIFVHAVPITSGDRVVGALAVIDDVTEHHRIEKTRRDFVANLSHELRTPVGAVSLLGEMIADEQDANTRTQLTERLLQETDRMSATIDDLLELSRIESDVQSYDEPVVIQDVVRDAVARVKVAAEAASVAVGVVGPVEPIVTLGNRDQMRSALINLVENGVKYSAPGDSVSVRARVDDGILTLAVQDTGRGIPARDIDRIFERFYRVDRSRDSATGGTGIGLSIVRHVALNHQGNVDVESFEGEGSTFSMNLPLVLPDSRAVVQAVDEAR